MNDELKVTRNGQILEVTLDRPKANAIDAATSTAMGQVFSDFRDDNDLRVAILTGGGDRFFSAGWDLKAAAEGESYDSDYGVGGFGGINELFDLNKPVIVAMNGHAIGGGFELALAADIALAAEGTVFIIPEVELGVPYLWGSTAMLAASLGMHRARNLVLGCDRFSAEDAERWGLVRAVLPAGELMPEAEKLARRLAAMPRHAMAAQKRLNNRLALRYMAWLEDEISLFLDG
mgnify:CR=1 FL=1